MWDAPVTPATSLTWWQAVLGAIGATALTAFGYKATGGGADKTSDDDNRKFEDRFKEIERRQNMQAETLTTHTTILSRLDSMASDIRSARDCTIKIAAQMGIEGPK